MPQMFTDIGANFRVFRAFRGSLFSFDIRVRSTHIEIRSKILSANPVTCIRHIDHPTSARIPILEISAALSEPFRRLEPTPSKPILSKI